MSKRPAWLAALGPGVLFTGTAVGVSHLVHSTRAGAMYGFGLVALVLLANLTKYPAFRFGPLYASATGRSMLEGYRRQGRWALALYGVLTVGTMFTVQAAITLVTAGLAMALFGLDWNVNLLSGGLLAVGTLLVLSGGYRALDGVAKIIVSALALCTIVATCLVLPRVDWTGTPWWPTRFEAADVAFMVALVGWMPSAIDVSVWQSLWTLARAKQTGERPSARDASRDFHLGYVGTAALAFCFVILGAALLHQPGVEIQQAPGAFARQLIELYVVALGEWSRPIIGGAAFMTMLSTLLTVIDGFPRALATLAGRFRGEETDDERPPERTPVYLISLVVMGGGSVLIIGMFTRAMPPLLDLAASLSFLSAPVLSWLNHRAVIAAEVPEASRPGPRMRAASWACIAFQGAFAIGFLALSVPKYLAG